MKILIACEYSGVVREAFRKRGHDAISCDILPTTIPGPHYQGSVLDILYDNWDMMICFPDCTYLCASGLHWNYKRPERWELTKQAIEFAKKLWSAPIPRISMENSIGVLSTEIREPDQIIQPYEFGEDASKGTCLWLKNLPLLKPTRRIPGRIVNGLERWSNQTDSGQNKLPPSDNRGLLRAKTYQGVADAMADQWGKLNHPIQTELFN